MKKMTIKVIPNAKRNEIKGGKVYLTAPAREEKANEALIAFLAEHFNVKKRQIYILQGLHSRTKVIEISS